MNLLQTLLNFRITCPKLTGPCPIYRGAIKHINSAALLRSFSVLASCQCHNSSISLLGGRNMAIAHYPGNRQVYCDVPPRKEASI